MIFFVKLRIIQILFFLGQNNHSEYKKYKIFVFLS